MYPLAYYVIVMFCGLFHSLATCQVRPSLHLTPYLNQRKISTARKLSLVTDDEGIIPISHAGFLTVNKLLMNHLFFWFFPALGGDPKAPLVVWLNGGPGVTSMLGLFYENGPLKMNRAADGSVSYERRNETWTQVFSLLYIDSPVGVGYSYSESGDKGFRTNQGGYTRDLYEFIQQFYKMFPEYLTRELYIGGQSYAGKYVPAFAYKIHTEILASKSNIPLTGIYLGGPLVDPKTQNPHFLDLYYALGYISHSQKVEFTKNVTSFLRKRTWEHRGFLAEDFRILFPIQCDDCWDNLATLQAAPYNDVDEMMTKLKANVHANTSNFSSINYDVRMKLLSDFPISTKRKLASLMDNYKVLIFTGEYDGIISSPMVEATLLSTPWSLQSKYNNSKWKSWIVKGHLAGFYTNVSRFCRVTIRGAGHQIPYDQPDNTLSMMQDFVKDGCVKNTYLGGVFKDK